MSKQDNDAILDAFAAEPDCRKSLAIYVRDYPHLAEEFVDIAWERRLSAEHPATDGVINDPKLNAAWEEFLAAGSKEKAGE